MLPTNPFWNFLWEKLYIQISAVTGTAHVIAQLQNYLLIVRSFVIDSNFHIIWFNEGNIKRLLIYKDELFVQEIPKHL